MCNKLVSAVIITHNRLALLKKAIKSAENQTYPNIEIIIVDDASTDGTKEYIEKCIEDGSPYKYYYIEKKDSKGGNHARNIGIAGSNGEYVAFLDDDDEWLETKVEKQVQCLDNNPGVGLVSCASIFVNSAGEKRFQDVNWVRSGDLSRTIFEKIPFTTSTIMVRRALLVETGNFDENLRFWQEYELLIRICQLTEVGIVRENLVLYRLNLDDRNRLSNNIDGWTDSVQYIESKHEQLIRSLPDSVKRNHQILIAHDGAVRAGNAHRGKLKRKYLREVFILNPSLRNFMKYVLNHA